MMDMHFKEMFVFIPQMNNASLININIKIVIAKIVHVNAKHAKIKTFV